MARPTAKLVLYIAANTIKIKRIKFPKLVSNKLTKIPGIVYMINHKITNKVIKPTTKFTFSLENKLLKEEAILYIIFVKKN